MSMTDRMAAVLRELQGNYDGAAETYVVDTLTARRMYPLIQELLASHTASRAALVANSIPQAGQHVRILRHADWGDEGIVIRAGQSLLDRQPGIVVQTADGAYQKLFPGEYEIIPNLPATNTGD